MKYIVWSTAVAVGFVTLASAADGDTLRPWLIPSDQDLHKCEARPSLQTATARTEHQKWHILQKDNSQVCVRTVHISHHRADLENCEQASKLSNETVSELHAITHNGAVVWVTPCSTDGGETYLNWFAEQRSRRPHTHDDLYASEAKSNLLSELPPQELHRAIEDRAHAMARSRAVLLQINRKKTGAPLSSELVTDLQKIKTVQTIEAEMLRWLQHEAYWSSQAHDPAQGLATEAYPDGRYKTVGELPRQRIYFTAGSQKAS